jgi:AP-1 complex subunit mu
MNYVQGNERSSPPPVFRIDQWCFGYLYRSSLYFVVVTRNNSNITMLLVFLEALEKVLKHYLEDLTPEAVVDNFALVYELLDEVMDYGYPQTVDADALEAYILKHKPANLRKQPAAVPIAATGLVTWRKEGIYYTINEVFIDVYERVNLLVAANGAIIQNEVEGQIDIISYLSGMPDLRLGLNDKVLLESGTGPQTDFSRRLFDVQDIKFHQCVRVSQYVKDRSITFVPPDRRFNLMTYRLSTTINPIIWIESTIERFKGSRVEILIVARAEYGSTSVADFVKVVIPVPCDAENPKGKHSAGTMKYVPKDNVIVWHIKQFAGQKHHTLKVHFGLSSIESESEDSRRPIHVEFSIPFFTMSGLRVLYMKVQDKSGYQASAWVKYVTTHATYEFRT